MTCTQPLPKADNLLVANNKHLEMLLKGTAHWNKWAEGRFNTTPPKADLSRANLFRADLSEANLSRANLSRADLSEADLSKANLNEANLNGTILRKTNLSEAKLRETDLSGADLSGAYLDTAYLSQAHLSGANLSEANLSDADLSGVKLRGANLSQADLSGADLTEGDPDLINTDLDSVAADLNGAYLRWAKLIGADLREAKLVGANLRWADLTRADLRGADLREANLRDASLSGANLSGAKVGWTIFGGVDLSTVEGLDTINHEGPSTVGIDTLYQSGGKIPEVFLRGAGVPDNFIAYASALVGQPIEFYSCFISYSTKDQPFADRLHADLQAKGVRCWFAPRHVSGGKKLHEQIDDAIRIYERLLLILSEHSMESEWVKTEIATARNREIKEKRRMLFPVRLVDFNTLRNWKCFDADTGKDSAREIREYFIPDFSRWKEHEPYQEALDRLLRDLKLESLTPPPE